MHLDSSRSALSQGFVVHWYEIDQVIGNGGFGITYLAHDQNLGRPVAIKEYMPEEFAVRVDGNTVQPRTKDKKGLYEWGLDRFIVEARILAQFNHPNIIRVLSVFEENNTAYMVMEYARGRDLAKIFKTEGVLSQEQLLDIFIPIVDGLVLVHNEHFIHRDIKPANIYIDTNNKPVLLDFGSARQSISGKTRPLTNILTYGYAPYEQYSEDYGEQGPWTDIYSLGACFYVGITGKKPVDALTRGGGLLKDGFDPYEPLSILLKGRYPDYFLGAIDNALMFKAAQRPQDVLTWASMLLGEIDVPPLPDYMCQRNSNYDDKTIPRPRRKNSFPTEPFYNSKGLINSQGKRNTNPTLDIQFSNDLNSTQHFRHSFKPAVFTILFLIFVTSVVLVAQMQFDFKMADFIDSFDHEDTQTHLAGEVDEKIEDPESQDTQDAVVDATDADNGESDIMKNVNAGIDSATPAESETASMIDPENEQDNRIEQLIREAKSSYFAKNYTSPENHNAVYFYKEVLTLDPGNAAAMRGLKQIENDFAERALQGLAIGDLSKGKKWLGELALLNPDADKLPELKSRIAKIEKENQELTMLLNHAKMLADKQHFVTPVDDNAYSLYKKILAQEPNNKVAVQGVKTIKDHYIELFNKHLSLSQFSDAENDLTILARLEINQVLYDGMEGKLASAKLQLNSEKEKSKNETPMQSKITMEHINQLLGSFKVSMENQDFNELNKISQFSTGREQFIRQLFSQYKTMKVHVSNVQYIPTRNQASAHVKISDLIQNNGYPVVPGDWSRFQIDMRPDQEQHLKIHW